MNDERLPFKLLTSERDEVKTRGCLRKCWLAHVNFLKKELNLQDKTLEIKLILEAPDKKSVRDLRWLYNINPNCMFIRN